MADRLFHDYTNVLDISGRSIAWKLFLLPHEPLDADLKADSLLKSLEQSRRRYRDLILEKLKAPDGSYEEGFVVPGTESQSPTRPATSASPGNLDKNNPLSLHAENPWVEWFAAVDLRKTIAQDVERTFPEVDFFRYPEVQNQLTSILFLYSVMNPDIGYRQGMHELLAPIYYVLEYDSISKSEDNGKRQHLGPICSRLWVAADAWALFDRVMEGVSRWYEWRETKPGNKSSLDPLSNHVHLNASDGQATVKTYVAPIVQACNHLQSNLLKSVDPQLWKHLQSTGIEPQIYGIRWLRLLFTREFILRDALKLWDALFACDPTFELTPWICVAMLIRIRNELIPSDYSAQLSILLRYPSPEPTNTKHHAVILVNQALTLQLSPTESTGSQIMLENQNLLDIPLEPLDPTPIVRSRPAPLPRSQQAPPQSPLTASHKQINSPQAAVFPDGLKRTLLEKGDSLGINKTVMNAVSELRRNLPDLASSAASLVWTPGPSNTNAYPVLERQADERPPWEPRSRNDLEGEIAALRRTSKMLGESLSWIVDTLLRDEEQAKDLEKLRGQKRGALESLSYVRDVLVGGITNIEEDRLVSEEELARRMQEHQKNNQNNPLRMAHPVAPSPLPVAESRPSFSNTPQVNRPAPPPIVAPPKASHTRHESLSPGATKPIAPWSYTRSNFSTPNTNIALPASSLPRPPPPTSATLQRPRPTSMAHSGPPQQPRDPGSIMTQPPSQRQKEASKGSLDPLGVL